MVRYRERHRKSCTTKIHQGTLLICYLTHLSRFCGVLEVQSEFFLDEKPRFHGGLLPFFFKVKRHVALEMEVAVPIKEEEVWNRLSITKERNLEKPGCWASFFINSLNRFNESDGRYLVDLLEKQEAKQKSYPLTEEERRRLAQKKRIRKR